MEVVTAFVNREAECLLAAPQFDTYTSTVRYHKTLQSLDITSVHKYYLKKIFHKKIN